MKKPLSILATLLLVVFFIVTPSEYNSDSSAVTITMSQGRYVDLDSDCYITAKGSEFFFLSDGNNDFVWSTPEVDPFGEVTYKVEKTLLRKGRWEIQGGSFEALVTPAHEEGVSFRYGLGTEARMALWIVSLLLAGLLLAILSLLPEM